MAQVACVLHLPQVLAVTKKMEDNKAEYESKLEEYAQLLDIRAARIRVSKTMVSLLCWSGGFMANEQGPV